MDNILLLGGTGKLGRKIAEELKAGGYAFTAVVRNTQKASTLAALATDTIVADVTNPAALKGICKGYTVVISALGKSVSPAERSKPSFEAVDYRANTAILEEALRSGVRKFVYVSAFGAEQHPDLTYFRVHHRFAEKLKASGIDYSIIKPPALFSAFLDMIPMARKGVLMTMGTGDKRTNPIYEGDLARICVEAIRQSRVEIEAGGQEVLTRHQINETIQRVVAPSKKVRSVPMGMTKAFLPVLKFLDRNTYDKMAFFVRVMEEDTLAPQVGTTRLEDYIRQQV